MPVSSSHTSSDSSSLRVPQERGSLRTLKEGRSEFIGSSSGIYFVNTVREAFSAANSQSTSTPLGVAQPSPEDCLLPGDEDDDQAYRSRRARASTVASQESSNLSYGPTIPLELGRPPPGDLAKQLFMSYFQTWHQFFPYLHGPTLLKDMELFYTPTEQQQVLNGRGPSPLPLAKVIILQCLFNLTSLHGEDLPVVSQIDPPVNIMPFLPNLAMKSDIMSIQALFAAQLLLIAHMSLRPAAVIGGLLSRSIFLAGLHRCPTRYPELSMEECNIRKRVFWSIYVVDRYLSQSLGQPLGIQDSDIDVCSLSKPELHDTHSLTPNKSRLHMSQLNATPLEDKSGKSTRPQSSLDSDSQVREQDRCSILASHVDHSRLLGNALELFHKSLHIRSIKPEFILSLRTDISAWWNALPSHLQNDNPSIEATGCMFGVSAFFSLLHNQIALLINRPCLSLEPSSPEFQSALQTCISSSREIITILKKQSDSGCALFWPGYLSAAWMAGIILAFACHLHLYPSEKGQMEISICLVLLSVMSEQWPLARNCHTVLSDLQKSFGAKENRGNDFSIDMPAATMGTRLRSPSIGDATNDARLTGKRRRLNDTSIGGPSSRIEATEGSTHHFEENRRTLHTQSTGQPPRILQGPEMRSPGDGNHRVSSGAEAAAGPKRGDLPPQNIDWHFAQANGGTEGGAMSGLSEPATMRSISTDNFQGDDARWMTEFGAMGSWDNGMPDIFAGATWGSLLHMVSEDNPTWDYPLQ